MTGRRFPWVEVLLVLGLSLGRSGVYAIVTLADRLTRDTSLAQQSAALNPQLSERVWLDVTQQALGITFSLVPVLLALYLLGLLPPRRAVADTSPGTAHGTAPDAPASRGRGVLRAGARAVGLTGARRQGRAWLHALGLAAIIGVPGLALYAVSRMVGLSVQISTSPEQVAWWTLVFLVLAALRNGLLEEVIAVGYLIERCDEAGVRPAVGVAASSLLRGSYHLYQGPAMAAGNVAMGVLYAAYYRRTRATWPLVLAHTLIDTVAFLGPALLSAQALARLGVA